MLTIAGDYIQGSLGVLDIEFAGLSQGITYDFLNITGRGFLDGALDVSFWNGLIPRWDNSLTFYTRQVGFSGHLNILTDRPWTPDCNGTFGTQARMSG